MQESIRTPPPHPHPRWALALNYAAMMCLAVAVNLIPVFLTTLSLDLGGPQGLTKEQLGRIGGVTFIGVVAGVALTGPLADRWGARLFALGGNLLIALGLGLLGAAPRYATVLLAVFVMGLGAGTLDMILSPIVAALQPHRRTAAMNWLHSFYCVGAVVTILVAALALKLGLAWRTIAFGLVAMPLVVALGFIRLHMPALVQAGQTRTRLRQLLRRPYFILALVAIFFAGATELGMAQWLPAYAEYTLGYSSWTGGMALMAFSVAMAVARIAAGLIGHRYSADRIMTVCCWLSVGLFIIACFAPWRAVALLASVAVGLTGSCLWPSMLGLAGDRYPHGGASMFGLLAAMGNFGGIFMPWMVGAVADASSLRWGLATSTLCPLIMIAALGALRRCPPPPFSLAPLQAHQ
ncbi:MAG: MFS transporter [Lentisphaerae bacterium]|nr:MFS transporter [Lentisphaerota bacterium]